MGSTAASLQSINPFVSAAVPGSPAVARAQAGDGRLGSRQPFLSALLIPISLASEQPGAELRAQPVQPVRPARVHQTQ